jgi:hypothetical protein
LQENKVFHALTSAYAKNKELEVYAATENIMRREKELCQMAIRDLQGLGGNADDTVGMILEHYQVRLQAASEKETKLKRLSEDSKKLNEEHRRKNQELAEVKRNLMESQSKLRDLAKVADKLSKKEEELRFIEGQLREELEKNRHEMLNGLYEIVAEFSAEGEGANPLGSRSSFLDRFGEGEGESAEEGPKEAFPLTPSAVPTLPDRTLFAETSAEEENSRWAPPKKPEAREAGPDPRRVAQLIERGARVKVFEPPKTICSKSLVKSPDGKLLCEYFFAAQAARDMRQYVFNTAYSLHFLLTCLEPAASGPTEFHKRLELAFGDLISRLDHGQTIHLEAACKDIFSREALGKLLGAKDAEKAVLFVELAEKCVQRFEALGPKRVELIEHQFAAMKSV